MLLALLLLLLLRTFLMDAGWGEGDSPLFELNLRGGVRALRGGFGKLGLRSEFSDFVVRRFSNVLSTFDPGTSFLMLSREALRVRGWMLSLREPIVGVSGLWDILELEEFLFIGVAVLIIGFELNDLFVTGV